MQLLTVAERPDLTEPAWLATRDAIPEYNGHGEVMGRYWGRLTEEFPQFQFHLVGDQEEVLARARAIPLRWDGSVTDLPAGIDGALERGFGEPGAVVLCALLVVVPPRLQGRGISAQALRAMADIARQHRLQGLIAPVRPSWKERYPLTPIEAYAAWRRPDGLAFDPWLRVHQRLGATLLKPEPRSLRIAAPVADWERWTEMAFPTSGEYWFPRGLATLAVNRELDTATYFEPNVWMRHPG